MVGLIRNIYFCMMVKVKIFVFRIIGYGIFYYRICVFVVYWFWNRYFVFKFKNGFIIIRNWGN